MEINGLANESLLSAGALVLRAFANLLRGDEHFAGAFAWLGTFGLDERCLRA